MKSLLFPVMLAALLVAGCAHRAASLTDPASAVASLPGPPAMVASNADHLPAPSPTLSVKVGDKGLDDYQDIDDPGPGSEEEKVVIADPLEPFNRAMYHFNDKLYFWVIKPVAQGYGNVVPEAARVSVNNFYTNIAFPIRFINCLLQANFKGAATEFGRFMVNTVWGVGGLLDPASHQEIGLSRQDEDFGQTLGVYGLGLGFYIHWPILGPSSPRDTVGTVGDVFLHPSWYFGPWYIWAGARAHEKVNDTSLKIGDYESLKEAAIDPYVAVRDAYVQYRLKQIKKKDANAAAQASEGEQP